MRTLRANLIHLAYQRPELRSDLLPLLKTASVVKPLYGHDGPDSAYVVEDYPYSFKLRTTIRYWMEHKPGKGYRFVSQTKDPKRGIWNKPKASTYIEIAAAMYLDEKGYVQWTGVGIYTEPKEILQFVSDFPGIKAPLLKVWAAKKVAYYKQLLAANAAGQTGWAINGVPEAATSADAERNTAELGAWTEVLKKL